ncbi:MAG: hypothetical protein HYS08_08100 [Chlamydiae bacterium]|nr:hypothetical protein [Chlamydiota bacterium]MBI3266046.1 hypothetical protein [Chlamydiota bacterium]
MRNLIPIRFNPALVTGGLVLLFLIASGLFLLRNTWVSKTKVTQDLENHFKAVQQIISTSQIPLTPAHVTEFTTQYEAMKKRYNDLLLLLDGAKPVQTNLSPLEFKEALLKTERLLIERAGLWNITLPQTIGFSEFESGNIPPATEVPHLCLELDALSTLANFLIESHIQSVDTITKKEVKEIPLPPSHVMYELLSFEMVIRCSQENLRNFLHKAHASNHLFIIRKLDIESNKNEPLTCSLQIDAIKFKRKEE